MLTKDDDQDDAADVSDLAVRAEARGEEQGCERGGEGDTGHEHQTGQPVPREVRVAAWIEHHSAEDLARAEALGEDDVASVPLRHEEEPAQQRDHAHGTGYEEDQVVVADEGAGEAHADDRCDHLDEPAEAGHTTVLRLGEPVRLGLDERVHRAAPARPT